MNSDRIYYSHDAEMQAMHNRTLLAVVFLTFGLGLGAILALLLAPSSGRIVRHDLARNVEEGLHSGRETVEPLVKRVEHGFDDLQKNVTEHLK